MDTERFTRCFVKYNLWKVYYINTDKVNENVSLQNEILVYRLITK